MTNDLRELIEEVKEGGVGDWGFTGGSPSSVLGDQWVIGLRAYEGSVDAAIALCEALLPGWLIELRQWPDSLCVATIRLPEAPAHQAQGPTLARALLLAVLLAKQMEGET